MCVGVMGTALASPLYPLYQQAWGLQPSHITLVFVAYMVAALASLLLLARLNDRYGFLPVLRAGLVIVTFGVLISACAWDVPSLIVGRVVIGVASGLITTSASLGLTQMGNQGDMQRASATTSLMMAFGFGLGPVVGGLVAQWAPAPLVTAYVPSLLLGIVAIWALWKMTLPAHLQAPAARQAVPLRLREWLPKVTLPEPRFARHFALGSMGAFCAFGIFSLYASLAPSFMDRMVPWHGPAVSGLSIGVILFLSAAAQYFARPVHPKTAMVVGLAALVLCNLLLLINNFIGSGLLFVLSVLTTALSHGLCNLAGIMVVNKVSTPANRAGLISTYLMIGYCGTIVPILGVGWLSDHIGLAQALVVFCICMAALASVLAVLTWRTPKLANPQG
ncbi:MFS transporter [Noviherbaspirillum sedimenti]|uniref:MFS transporter n=1 Tax=Noviherbaspirillum sedimenti TaxID=2320865 RepID=A0A3A3FZM3_9BURK|nr:MFS transporter [Noviherbaspirillum sedimenti]RJG01121.1 MFS transporter [Noviherbaspirillum sedimenti]